MNSGVDEDEADRDERGEREAVAEDELDDASAAGKAEKMPVFSLVYTSTTWLVVGSMVRITRQSSATSAGERATRTA